VSCPTLVDAQKRGLLAAEGDAVHTFSNHTSWECWASGNCFECRRWDHEEAGKYCAFEYAAFMNMVSPALAEMFGWVNDPKYGPKSYTEPNQCRFFLRRDGDDNDPPPPPPDPNQLVLIADPTEDSAMLTHHEERSEVMV
jgi:hypothetical protein